MKRILASLVLTVATICAAILPSFAQQSEDVVNPIGVREGLDGATIVYYEDGSSLSISQAYITNKNDMISTYSSEISGNKDVVFKDSNGNVEWKYTLHGTFFYVSGVSSSCTNAYYTNNIYENSWSFSDGSATTTRNRADGKGKYVCKVLLVTVKTYNIDISISCDRYGKLT